MSKPGCILLPRGFKAWRAGEGIVLPPAKPPPGEREVCRMRHWRESPEAPYPQLRAALFPKRGHQPANLISLLDGPGCHEIAEPIAWAFRMLARQVNVLPARRAVRVPVKRVLSHAWQPVRIARLFEPKRGRKIPPVTLWEVRFRGEHFYLVADGHHRCEVAKMRGEEHVLAVIEDVRHFVPDDWAPAPGGFRHRRKGTLQAVAADLRAAGRWLGIKTR